MNSLQGAARNWAIPIAVYLIALAILLSLGVWQLKRGAQKQVIVDQYRSRIDAPAIRIGSDPVNPVGLEYALGEAVGQFEEQYQILLDNKVHRGRPGYHVLTPFRIQGGEMRILVNRGWVPWGVSRDELPKLEIPSQEMRVTGQVYLPSDDYYTLETKDPDFSQPVWQNLDLPRYTELAPHPVHPFILRLSPSASGGYVREWPVYTDAWVARHRAYAIQWFGLAVVLTIIFGFAWWRWRKG